MLNWMSKRKWLAVVLVFCLVLTLLPTDFSWAKDGLVNSEETTTIEEVASEGEEASSSEEITTEVNSEEIEPEQQDSTEELSMETTGLVGMSVEGGEEETNLLGASEVMLSTGNFDLTNLDLSASYKDADNTSHTVEMKTTEGVTLPDNATISLNFDFIMYDGDLVEIGKEYIYPIPDGIRIDVNETLQLMTNDDKSIGTVKIDRDNQRLVFVFNNNVDNQVNIPFYVRFAGGLSADAQEDAEDVSISFATATGSFDYNVTVEDAYNNPTPSTPGDLGMTKSANKVYVDGKPYIEWNLSLNLNGRETLDAEITDVLPSGLTYEAVGGYPKITDTKDNNAKVTGAVSAGNVLTLNISDVTTYYRANVKFLTSYDNSIFSGEIDNNTSATVANTASILEDGSTTATVSSGNAVVTPSVLSKSGTKNGNVITWTVVINKDQLDVGGATYTDTFGSGYLWNTNNGSYNASCITVNPSGAGTVSNTSNNGFTFTVDEAYKNNTITLTYETKISDYTVTKFDNEGKLEKTDKYNVTTSANVSGYNLLSKNNVNYNEVTRQLTWNITVNGEKATDIFNSAGDVTISDIFNPNAKQNKMILKSMKITGASGTHSLEEFSSFQANANGEITLLGSLLSGTTLTVTVVTEIDSVTNPYYTPKSWDPDPIPAWSDGEYVNVVNNATLSWNTTTIPASASKGFQYKTPELLKKTGSQPTYSDGTPKGDGTIEWKIVTNTYQQDMTVNTITLTDTIPGKLEYVPGSMYINKQWDGTKYPVTPTFDRGTNKLTITFERTMTGVADCMDNPYNFEIHYLTRLKSTQQDKANTECTYTNNATFDVDYDGLSIVSDTDSATVTGTLGGELRKEAFYQSGKDYVDWEVAINEGRFDMSSINNPVIRDTLASYLQYVQSSGKLYKVDVNGNRSEVTSGFAVNVINNDLVVSLPNIGSDTYIFAFRTRFTVSQANAADLNFKNDVSFQGEGYSKSVSSNQVKNVSFSSSSAGAYHENELRLVKTNANGDRLAGAVFEIMDSMGTVIASATSDANGVALFKGVKLSSEGYTYKVKEITAPDRYILDTTPIDISIDAWQTDRDGTRYYEKEVVNQPITQSTSFTILKASTVGAKPLEGATFSVYTDVAMTDAYLLNQKTTEADGKVTFEVSYDTNNAKTLYVKETGVPDGYKPAGNVYYEVTIGTDGSVASVNKVDGGVSTSVSVNNATFTVDNTPAVGSFAIKKTVKDIGTPIVNVLFTLYKDVQCSDEVATETTNGSGLLTFDNLEIGRTYYYKEVSVPNGYVLDGTVRSITIDDPTKHDADGSIHQDITVMETIENELAKGSIKVMKVDNSTPAKPLKDAKFTLYATSNLNNPYNEPGTSSPYVVTTGADGVALFENLPFGDYVVKETGIPTGYMTIVPNASTNVTIDSVATKEVTVVNDVIKFDIRIYKQDDSSPGVPLEGAYFVVRNSNGTIVGQGETDADGKLTITNLPYDTYTITETRGIAGYTMASSPQTVDPAAHMVTNGTTIPVPFPNHKQNGQIKIKKVDSVNNSTTLSNAEFTLYNASGDVVATKTTDALGIILFDGLPYGDYKVKETRAPAGYQINTTEYDVTVSDDIVKDIGVVLSDYTKGIKDVKIPTGNNYMHFRLTKSDDNGKLLSGAQFTLVKNFPSGGPYGTSNDNGAPGSYTAYSDQYGVVEFKDVYIEHDPAGTTYTLKETKAPYGYRVNQSVIFDSYSKEQMVGNESGTSGIAIGTTNNWATDGGSSTIPDITKVVGIDSANLYVKDGNTSYLINTKLLGTIRITKKASGSVNTFLQGAEFTLYKFNATNNQYEQYSATGIVNPQTTDSNGIVTFAALPLGKYRVVETKAPKGYILNPANQRDFEITETNYNDITALSAAILNAPYSITVNKYEMGGATQLSGAVLGLYNSTDTSYSNCIERWTTSNNPHKLTSSNLIAGTEYVIHEIQAPKGYAICPQNVKFKVNADGTVSYTGATGSLYGTASGTTVTMRDDRLSLYVLKQGHDATASPNTYNLSGASLSLIDDETGAVVYSFTSTANRQEIPYSVLSGPTGTNEAHFYTVRETSAPGGYALAEDIKIAVKADGSVCKVNANGTIGSPISNKTVIMTDEKYTNFYFAKRDKQTGDVLIGAKFGIYADNVWESNPQRTNDSYATDASSDEPLHWTSTAAPKNVSLSVGTYYFVELEAPVGYELEAPIKFQVCAGTPDYIEVLEDSGNSNLSANRLMLTSRDSSLTVKFVKWSDTFQPLRGGTFTLHASDRNKTIGAAIGNSFSAQGGAITLDNTMFELEKYYVITEDVAPAGYTVAEPLFFYIDASGQLKDLDGNNIDNNMLIFIDGEKQFGFKKVDGITGEPVSGVRMRIYSSEDSSFAPIEWTTDGSTKYVPMNTFASGKSYILEEVNTINGYAYAESMTFKYIAGSGGASDTIYIDGTQVQTMNIVMKDEPFDIYVDKYITGTATNLSGATLQVTDSAGVILDSWVTDDSTHKLDSTKYMASKTAGEYMYTLTEAEAPELYAKAQPIAFYVDKNGQVRTANDTVVANNTLAMYDEYLGIAISKQDVAGKEVPGAKLTITSSEDSTFTPITWISTSTPYNISRDLFKPGVTYTLTETAAPDGYAYAESIDFMIDADGNVYVGGQPVTDKTIVMVDKVLSLNLSKKVTGTDRYLKGASFGVFDVETGNRILTFTSEDGVTKVDTGKLKTSHGEDAVFYLIRELEAPVGYELCKDKYFYFDDKGALYVLNDEETLFELSGDNTITMYDAPSTTSSKKTGDTSPVRAMGMMFYLSLAGLGSIMAMRRKGKR